MTPTESESNKRSQDERPFSPEMNMERSKRSKRSNVNSPKPRSNVRTDSRESYGSRQNSFEEEPRPDTGDEPIAKIVKMETDKEQGYKLPAVRKDFCKRFIGQKSKNEF